MKKTVAIITMHKVFNYGSILQTFALFRYISSLGYEVIIVDYKFPNEYHLSVAHKHSVEESNKNWGHQHLNGLCSRLLKINNNRKVELFNAFMKENIKLSKPYSSAEELKSDSPKAEIYVTGSDQVWNPRYVGEDFSFALNWVSDNNTKKISYAASFGVNLCPADFADKLAQHLKQYNRISVREYNKLLGDNDIKYEITLDPTFLLNRTDWCQFFEKDPIVKGKYLLCYLIGYSYNPFPYVNKLTEYIHKKSGLKVVMISGEPINFLRGYKLFNDCGPKEFLNLFYNASMVLTTSFHGTAFAINFNKPFITVIDDKSSNDNRQRNLVELVGLGESHILECNTPFKDVTIPSITVEYAPKLEEVRLSSQKFLKHSLYE